MSDLALKSVGLACAAGSVWFAVFMFSHQDGGPRIYDMKDFAIFAQPNRVKAVETAVRVAAADGRARGSRRAIAIDMTPVGAVPARPEATGEPQRRDVRIVELNADNALLEFAEWLSQGPGRRRRPGNRKNHRDPADGRLLGGGRQPALAGAGRADDRRRPAAAPLS